MRLSGLRGERRDGGTSDGADDADAGGRRRRLPWALIGAWAAFLLVLAGGAVWLHLAGPLPASDRPPAADMATGTGAETSDPAASDPPASDTLAADGANDLATAAPDANTGTVPPPPTDEGGEAAMAESDTPAEVAAPVDEQPPPLPPLDPAWLARTQAPLPPAPDPSLQEDSLDGPLPRPGADGRTPWQAYARPFEDDDGRPRIAIVVGSLGLASPATVQAIGDLPGQVSLSLSPYANNLDDWVVQARGKGHEVLLTLPVQPPGFPGNDPGPNALLAELSPPENAARLRWILSRASGYVGVATETPSPLTANTESALALLAAIAGHGLMFLDGAADNSVAAANAAGAAGTPFASVDLHLDTVPTPTAIDAALAELERLARENGQAVGFARPLPISIDRIAAWAQALEARGFALAPLTGILGAGGSG